MLMETTVPGEGRACQAGDGFNPWGWDPERQCACCGEPFADGREFCPACEEAAAWIELEGCRWLSDYAAAVDALDQCITRILDTQAAIEAMRSDQYDHDVDRLWATA